MTNQDILKQVLKDSNYDLSLFDDSALVELRRKVVIKEVRGKEKPYVKCLKRDKDILLKPEEIVRQLYLDKLINHYGYPLDRITVEHPVAFGTETKFADIVIFDIDDGTVEYIIVELKNQNSKTVKNN